MTRFVVASSDVLRAVLAKLEMRSMLIRFRPRAAGAVDAANLIHFQHRASAANEPVSSERLFTAATIAGTPPALFDSFDIVTQIMLKA